MLSPATISPQADPQTAVRVLSLGHRYGDRVALRDVSFSVEAGEVFGVLGPNGGGKSTLFRILSTMIPAGSGKIELFGRDPNIAKSSVRRDLGIVFQAPSLDPFLTARENLLHQGHLYGLSGRGLDMRMSELLALFDLADRRNERVSKFSGGLRRRVEIAKSLLHQPRLLILDEPSTGLDPGARRDMWAYLNELRTRTGMTVLFTTHYMDEAEHATRVAVLDRGQLIAVDTPEALKSQLGGDVITIETDEPHALARQIQERFGIETVVLEDRLRLERVRGHEFVTTLVEAFPGRIHSISVGKATLEDVFIHLTGHRLEENVAS
ncbi:MAG TPA: ABC transporter ATP-binding protein [Dongiaceae bacterium]|jgi:ABC-2 type transport system ATP-binding protein|nr:ABC transporter ATP-binding protein [Dongiaceae bacterium]